MRTPAQIAAHQAADAVAALLLYDDEGYFDDLGVVEKLAGALVHTIDLRKAEVESCDHAFLAALAALRQSAVGYLETVAG